MKPYRRTPLIDRLKRGLELDESTGCWNWIGAKGEFGHGYIGRGGKGAGQIGTHRAAWEIWVGPIAPGHHIHHKCVNPSCCNPEHLQCLTPYEHKQIEPSSHVHRTHCKYGHPFSGENLRTIITKSGYTHRYCRQCDRDKANRRYRKQNPVKKVRVLKAECKWGHPLSGSNLSPSALKQGLRVCLACQRRKTTERYHANLDASRTYIREYVRKTRAAEKALGTGLPSTTEGNPLNRIVG